ncbi:MAG: InlB B-repeat-containing protein, partial [Bacilli bacterium]|nr:InlB B-repeat-containing protein [Bacilli bacterium]
KVIYVSLPLMCASLLVGCGQKSYTVTWVNYDGTTLEIDNANYGEMPSYDGATPTRVRDCSYIYTFNGWSPNIVAVTNDQIYVATYAGQKDLINFSITYELNGGENSPLNPSTYTIEDSIVFENPTKNGYSFLGWFDENNAKVESIESGSAGNVHLEAKWQLNKYGLSISSNDSSKGTVTILSGEGYSFEQITVSANPADGSEFTGWYHDDVLVDENQKFTFTMPTNDYSLVAHFYTNEELNDRYARKPILSNDKKSVAFGLYPQRNINDKTIVSALNSMTAPTVNDWYCYNDDFYAKATAEPYFNNFTFENGDLVEEGKTYWFKCEPIIWNVLKNENDEYFLLSNDLLDRQTFYHSQETREIEGKTIYPNNYEYSDLRHWLNNDFYNSAFAFGSDLVLTTEVDNVSGEHGPYTCENTFDKVFAMSYQDAINADYGFETEFKTKSTARIGKVTDYAKAKGSFASRTDGYVNNGYYWLRSPHQGYGNHAWAVDHDGSLYVGYRVDNAFGSVRPCINIKIGDAIN